MTEWKWIVLLNGAFGKMADFQAIKAGDDRINFVVSGSGSTNVGALKSEACAHVSAPYCVEFDHDDELSTDCLEQVFSAFEATGAALVFSSPAAVRDDGKEQKFRADYGWVVKTARFLGEKEEVLPVYEWPLILPQNISRIWFAPDHVRAWRMDAYRACGGHNPALSICDDQDLMCRLYLVSGGAFHRIDACLYKYRIHGENTFLKRNREIQETTMRLHDQYLEPLALAHWKRRARCIDLGGGIDCPDGWESCDVHHATVTADLNEPWPFSNDSVGVFRAHDIVEHLKNPIHVMNEAHRCLVHGGLFCIEVPSTDGRGAFQDPSHVSFWNANSFWYYCREAQQKYIRHLGVNCRFQAVRIVDYFPSQWHQENKIPYVRAHLAAIKDGPRLHGPYDI